MVEGVGRGREVTDTVLSGRYCTVQRERGLKDPVIFQSGKVSDEQEIKDSKRMKSLGHQTAKVRPLLFDQGG